MIFSAIITTMLHIIVYGQSRYRVWLSGESYPCQL